MKKFVGQAKTDQYFVGCTGQTVFLCDTTGAEIAQFKDIKYGYMPLFAPDGDRFIVKSTAGWMAAYSAEKRELIAKWPLARKDSQDHGFCFSSDGKYLFNIEMAAKTVSTELAVYDASTLQETARYFSGKADLLYNSVEPCESGVCLLGMTRSEAGTLCFVEKLVDGQIVRRRELSEAEHRELQIYATLKLYGFTQNIIELYRPLYEMELMLRGITGQMPDWSALGTLPDIRLEEILENGFVSPFFRD